jgi:hypothetical protein
VPYRIGEPVSILKDGDESMHYSDGSHRWSDDPAERTALEVHMEAHRDSGNEGRAPARPGPKQPGSRR